jgi:hypothetical protein
MAENRGGYRPSAPQNNPANVSATGGNGQSGKQPMRNYTGMGYGGSKALADQQRGAAMQGKPTMPALAAAPVNPSYGISPVIPLDAPTSNPTEDVMSGVNAGPGPGFDATGLPRSQQLQNNDFKNALSAYAPVLKYVASRGDASVETRAAIALLLRDI